MLAVAQPPAFAGASSSGALRGSPTPSALLRTGPAASKLAESVLSLTEGLTHCSPFLQCRLHCSAMPRGQGNPHERKGPIIISIVGEASSFFLLAAGSRRFDQK